MIGVQCKLDWSRIEPGIKEHLEGSVRLAAGCPELAAEKFPGFQPPEVTKSLEDLLRICIVHCGPIADSSGWNVATIVPLMKTVLLWLDNLGSGNCNVAPVVALWELLRATSMPDIAESVPTIVARAELDFTIEQLNGQTSRVYTCTI